jgi:acyl carrier protein
VAANTFLDALAHYRQQQGLAGLSINWGAWAEIGEAARRQADDFVKLRGIGTLQPQQGLQVLEQLLTQPLPQIGVLPIDWSQFLASREVLPFFAAFQDKASVIKQQYSDAEVVKHLKSLSVTERQEYLLQYVQTQVANILGFQAEQLDVQQGFFDLGMDSLTSVELRNRLQKNLDCALPSTVLFKYPTIVKLVEYLAKDVLVMEDKAETTVTETTTTVAHMNEEAMLAMIEEEFEALGLKGS